MLAGPKSLTIVDHRATVVPDFGTQFFLCSDDLGKNRAVASGPKLAELNPYVTPDAPGWSGTSFEASKEACPPSSVTIHIAISASVFLSLAHATYKSQIDSCGIFSVDTFGWTLPK